MFNIGSKEELDFEIDKLGVNTLRGIGIDMIYNKKSGHPGIVLGAASIIYTFFKYHMNLDLDNLNFINRDRFILSAGHGAPLLYGIDYFLGLLDIDDLKNLRTINSKTPGHPEKDITPMVEVTTGLLGQGVANAVGISYGEKYLRESTNKTIDYYTYVLCGDGELEEGITYEALTLAGTWNLNKLIVFVDLNNNTLDGSLDLSSHEDLKKRFESINFNIIETDDSVKNINEAIISAKNSDKPSVILVKTKIGAYSSLEGNFKAHGSIPDEEEFFKIKNNLGLIPTTFEVSEEVINSFKEKVRERSNIIKEEFNKKYELLKNKELIDKLINKENTYNVLDIKGEYEEKSLREHAGDLLNKISNDFPLILSGSADLFSSCKNKIEDSNRNIYFGIREHAMGGILNGLATLGFRPFGSTFLAFSDYLRPSLRMTAMMNLGVTYIFTNDSITIGEDGPTHEPIEQLPSLELIPNLKIYRPYDVNELIGCFKDILKENKPSCLIIPRNNKEISISTSSKGVESGIYEVIKNDTDNYINLISNGEELGLVLKVSKNLKEIGIDNRVFSIPCIKNIKADIDSLWKGHLTIGITLASVEYLYKFTKNVIGINTFGLSGSREDVLENFGFTEELLQSKILEYINK